MKEKRTTDTALVADENVVMLAEEVDLVAKAAESITGDGTEVGQIRVIQSRVEPIQRKTNIGERNRRRLVPREAGKVPLDQNDTKRKASWIAAAMKAGRVRRFWSYLVIRREMSPLSSI